MKILWTTPQPRPPRNFGMRVTTYATEHLKYVAVQGCRNFLASKIALHSGAGPNRSCW